MYGMINGKVKSSWIGPIAWEEFNNAFLDRFLPLEMREGKIKEFINLN